MKKGLLIILVMFVLSGCTAGETSVERVVNLRNRVQKGNGCKFEAIVSADYSDHLYCFRMECETDNLGNLKFTVLEPETIAGISGTITHDSGKLTFDNNVLAFELMAEGRISPVSTPWLFMKTLGGGFIKACTDGTDGMHVQIDDSYAGDPMLMELWTNQQDLPIHCDFIWQGVRVVSMDVENFTIL